MDAAHVGGLGGTYGGNPVACAAALGAIRTMREQDLAAPRDGDRRAHAARAARACRTSILSSATSAVAAPWSPSSSPSRAPSSPTPRRRRRIAKLCHAAGLVVLTCGTYGNVLRFLPPLVMPDHLLDEGLSILGEAFAAAA